MSNLTWILGAGGGLSTLIFYWLWQRSKKLVAVAEERRDDALEAYSQFQEWATRQVAQREAIIKGLKGELRELDSMLAECNGPGAVRKRLNRILRSVTKDSKAAGGTVTPIRPTPGNARR